MRSMFCTPCLPPVLEFGFNHLTFIFFVKQWERERERERGGSGWSQLRRVKSCLVFEVLDFSMWHFLKLFSGTFLVILSFSSLVGNYCAVPVYHTHYSPELQDTHGVNCFIRNMLKIVGFLFHNVSTRKCTLYISGNTLAKMFFMQFRISILTQKIVNRMLRVLASVNLQIKNEHDSSVLKSVA